MVTIAVPVLNRPERVRGVLERFKGHRVVFLPDEGDHDTITEIVVTGAEWYIAPPAKDFGVPTFASKVNHAYRVTNTPFLVYGADDIHPEPNWWHWAEQILEEDQTIGLLGTYDGVRPHSMHLRFATHGIVRRSYVERYGSASLPDAGPIFWEGYRHACVDVEITGVANSRGAYYYAPDVGLRHERAIDETMQLGESYLEEDRARMRARQTRWRDGVVQ